MGWYGNMTDEPSFCGIPIKIATPEQQRRAIEHGEFIHRAEGMAFYQIGNNVFIVEADKPVSLKQR